MALFSHFCAISDILTNFFHFLSLGNLDFIQKKFFNLDDWKVSEREIPKTWIYVFQKTIQTIQLFNVPKEHYTL